MRDFDIDLLRTLATIAETGSFTRAAERLGRTQSTISLQIKRLEDGVGCRLLDRTDRAVAPTVEGEVLLGYARRILALNDEARDRLADPEVAGAVRLGTPEDFATIHLPGALARFAEAHPRVLLEVRCDYTLNLMEAFRRGEFDLVLVKREPMGTQGGAVVWREPLVWVMGPKPPPEEGPLPLVLSPPPDVYRRRALDALDRAGRPWRVVYSSTSLAGTQAAVAAGLGVTVLPKDMVPDGFSVIEGPLPRLEDTEMALLMAETPAPVAQRLAEHIALSLERRRHHPRG